MDAGQQQRARKRCSRLLHQQLRASLATPYLTSAFFAQEEHYGVAASTILYVRAAFGLRLLVCAESIVLIVIVMDLSEIA
jgi:hypothetical protein